jgi:hypothetical protein
MKQESLSHVKKDIGPFNYESYKTCKTCLLDKMTKTPFYCKCDISNELFV